jgi:hypothetical protein
VHQFWFNLRIEWQNMFTICHADGGFCCRHQSEELSLDRRFWRWCTNIAENLTLWHLAAFWQAFLNVCSRTHKGTLQWKFHISVGLDDSELKIPQFHPV